MLFAPGRHSARAKTAMACLVWICYFAACLHRFSHLGQYRSTRCKRSSPPSCLSWMATTGRTCRYRVVRTSTVREHRQGKEGVRACREPPPEHGPTSPVYPVIAPL